MRFLLFIIGSLLLMGCAQIKKSSTFYGRTNQYLTAQSIPPLKIPPGLSSNSFENYYPVSDRNYPEAEKIISVVPPGLYDNQKMN